MGDRPPPFAAAVLCGGASRRMGRDKSLLPIDGTAMAARVAAAAATAGASTVLAVGGDRVGLEAAGLAYRPDRWPGQGPLGGVITALAGITKANDVAVMACDLVQPDPDLIAELVRRRRSTDADVAVPVDDGRHQWTHAVWHRRSLPALAAGFGAGIRALHRAVGALVTTTVVVVPGATADADRPEDLSSGEPSQ